MSATFNCVDVLPGLINSLRLQTNKNFEWIVADGASTDGTLDLLQSTRDLNITILSQPDFGIYDALNRAINYVSSDYYVVAGADDVFHVDAINNFQLAIRRSGADILAANVVYGSRCFRIKKGPPWLFGEKSYIANHSVGTAFRKELHERFGFYSKKFPIAADSLFVVQASMGNASRAELDFIAGRIGAGGVSAVDWAGAATELYRVQLIAGGSVILQTLLLLLRIFKGASGRTLYHVVKRLARTS